MKLMFHISKLMIVSTTIAVSPAAFAQLDGPDANLFGSPSADLIAPPVNGNSAAAVTSSGAIAPSVSGQPVEVRSPSSAPGSAEAGTRLKDLVPTTPSAATVSPPSNAPASAPAPAPASNPRTASSVKPHNTAASVKGANDDGQVPPTPETRTAATVKPHATPLFSVPETRTAATVKPKETGATVPPTPETRTAATVKPKETGVTVPPTPETRTAATVKPKDDGAQVPPTPETRTAATVKPKDTGATVPPTPETRTAATVKPKDDGAHVPPTPETRTAATVKPKETGATVPPTPETRTAATVKPKDDGAQVPPTPETRTAATVKPKDVDAEVPPTPETRTAATVKPKDDGAEVPPTPETRTAATVKPKEDGEQAPPTPETRTAATVKGRPTAASVKGSDGFGVASVPETRTAATVKAGSSLENALRLNAGNSNGKCNKAESGSVGGLRAFSAQLAKAGADDFVEEDSDPLMKDLLPAYIKAKNAKSIPTPSLGHVNPNLKKLWSALKGELTKSYCARKGTCGKRSRTKRPDKPAGMCAQGVRMAFEKAFGKPFGAYKRGFAKYAGPNFKKYGWQKMTPIGDVKKLPIGAVLIYTNTLDAGHPGHIEVKMPDGYYSDFYEKGMINEPVSKGGLGIRERKIVEVWVPPAA